MNGTAQNLIDRLQRRARNFRRAAAWQLSPKRVSSQRALRALKDKHKGQRCFIIGNGPSLRDTDLTRLEHEITFGLNRIYLMFEELGFSTTYFTCVNRLVLEQCAGDIVRLPMPKFISWSGYDLFPPVENLMYLRSLRGPLFCTDVTEGVWEGATVTYVAMQVAYYMGFQQVILVGVDHSFATKGKPHTAVVSEGPDPNHFHPGYFGKGFRWNLPDLETSEIAYTLARQQFQQDGREIIDATVGGKLQVFPKVDYTTLF